MSIDLRKDRRILKALVNNNFSFADLDKKFEGVDSSTGNIFCPFHENKSSPSAKMYFNEDTNMYTIWCFRESRNFTAYDYVDKILCVEKNKYRDVVTFLEARMNKAEILTQYNNLLKNINSMDEKTIQKKIDYIDNIYVDCENTEEYIERVYLENYEFND